MAQNFGNQRIIKQGSNGASLSWLETTSHPIGGSPRALLVEVVSMPAIAVSIPPITLADVSVIQKTTPWIVSGDVSTTIAFPASAQVFVNNPASSPVPVTGPLTLAELTAGGTVVQTTLLTSPLSVQQSGTWLVSVTGDVSIKSPVSVTGEVSVKNFPTATSVTGDVSIKNTSLAPVQVTVQSFQAAVSVTGDVSVKNTVSVDVIDRANRALGTVSVANLLTAVSVTGDVSVKNFPTVTSVTQGTSPWVIAGDVSLKSAVSVTGQVSVLGPVSVTGQVSVLGPVSVTGHVSIDNTSLNPVQVTVQSFQTAVSVTGEVSVVQKTSPWVVSLPGVVSVAGNVSVLGQVSIVGPVSVTGQVSTQTMRTNLTAGTPTHASVANTTCLALAANANRKGLILSNKNTAQVAGIPVYLGIATVAVLGSGIVLYPNGGTWEMDEWTFSTGSIAAIASAAGIACLSIQEFS